MSASDAASTQEWFEDWFGEEYLQLYPHRDDEEAERAVALIAAHAGLPGGASVMDLACGAGRHVEHLREHGYSAFGLDLSLDLLRVARGDGLAVVRGDMRALPVGTGRVAMVTSFFTSFGYFPDERDDERVLREIRRVLRPGGLFAVDFLNAERVRAGLRERDEVELGRRRVVQTRELVEEGRVVQKRIEIYEHGKRQPRVFFERVRLYGPGELGEMLAAAGIEPFAAFGDYGGGPVGAGAPRVILMGRAR
ncbi:MAG TPA: class I SAM-dependent methyltransferase [Longimicrobium sp.]|jgi:SAM-dependent methyltransferase|nr:class I SAM-dependent methyltransferase [Longimicrobium sp.]